MKDFIIGVDFDGTIVKHEFPDIGDPVPEAFEWIKRLSDAGAKWILHTMRGDHPETGDHITPAVEFCRGMGVEFWAVNVNPTQVSWTNSRKVYAHVYVDDAALGCPLVRDDHDRPYVDWGVVGPMLMERLLECQIPISK